ncbi:MAG: insulinase family protein [Gemmatimonadaceae bacterium]|nr:insulinase family protein [Gemmatimonadaceae bacterium]
MSDGTGGTRAAGAAGAAAMITPKASDALVLHRDTVREVLPNGLTLLVRRDTAAPVVAVVTHVKAGYFDESDDIVGIAHVLEHMFFKGTPTRGVGSIARDTKASGGYLNAHTIYDHTSYYTVLPAASFVQGLDIQFDAYARSLIDAGELSRELEVIIQEVKRKRDSPTAVTIESLYALLHDRHRIRRWRIGEEAALRDFTQQAVQRFYRAWYQPSNTILSIVGDVDPDTVRHEVRVRHGSLDNQTVPRMPGLTEIAPSGFRLRDIAGDIVQPQIAFGWRAPDIGHADTPALDLAGVALGTGRASRLYRAVRDRQLASSVSAWHYTAGDVGVFVVHAEATNDHAVQAVQQTWREVQAAREQGFRASEVARAQRILEARWLRRLETMDGQATYLASWEADGGLERASAYYDRLLSLDTETLHDAMQRHLDPMQVSVVSYRPASGQPLAADADALRQLLREMEGQGSSVLPPPQVPTPVRGVPTRPDATSRVVHRTPHLVHGAHVHELPSGVSVIVVPRPGAPLVSVGLFQRGGAGAEPPGREGLARLTAHAMLKGTTTRSGAQIAEAVEELGASISVSAGLETLGWSLSVPVRNLSAAVATLADIAQRPAFPDDGIDTERSLALAEVTRLRDDMFRWPMRLATAAAYGVHPYARTVIGTPESLGAIDTHAVRAFHAGQILHGATVIALVGDLDVRAAVAMIEREFESLTFRDNADVSATPWPTERLTADDARDKQQTAMALLFPGPRRTDADRFAARVLSAVASGLGGRFFEQLRDRQSLAYTVSAYPVERRAGGAFAAYIATSPAREDEAREGLLSEFAKLREASPTAEEMDRARRYLIGSHAIAQQVGSTVMGEVVDAWLLGGGVGEREEYVARITAVTARDVQALAQRYFDPARVVEGIVRGHRVS